MFFSRRPVSIRPRATDVFQFPEPETIHLATVRDRARNSGLTSVRFVDDDTLIVADFNDKKCYLVRVAGGAMTILDTHDTIVGSGTPVQTDLSDYRDGVFIVSNFYQGSFSVFRIGDDRISFLKEVKTADMPSLHGVRFIPDQQDLVWLAYCNNKKKCHQIVDWRTERVLHEMTVGEQCQDVAFAPGHAVVFARTNHILKGDRKARFGSRKRIMYATAYVYRMPDDLRATAPHHVSTWRGRGHIDACKEAVDGRIYCANQYLDRIDVFRVSVDGRLHMEGKIDGMRMPHGLDLRDNRLAVTNYADQSLRIVHLDDRHAPM